MGLEIPDGNHLEHPGGGKQQPCFDVGLQIRRTCGMQQPVPSSHGVFCFYGDGSFGGL